MSIHLNPLAQAEMDIRAMLNPSGMLPGEIAIGIIRTAVLAEKLMLGQHEDCGADNPEGTVAKCKCFCHKGHYRHCWTSIIKTPQQLPDGTYQLLDRCKYCPDIRLKIIKPAWKDEKHTLVSLEYLIRGEQRVLTKEEWLERAPKTQDVNLIREVKL